MLRRSMLFTLFLAAAACSENAAVPAAAPATPQVNARSRLAARERLTEALATALADSSFRASLHRRLQASNAREGKLQFQALLHADQQSMLLSLARRASRDPGELLADLDAARGLEIYLPVPAQRATWTGGSDLIVATTERDGDAPVGYDLSGHRLVLDPRTPPTTPVLALVPQETDFTRGHPEMMTVCYDMCGGGDGGGGGGGGGGGSGSYNGPPASVGQAVPGIYLVQSHFDDTYEGWLKGAPEYEYHVYGLGDNGQTVQLACTGPSSSGAYVWNQTTLDWTGSALLFSDAQNAAYQAKHPDSPIRIMAWEDDDEACVDHADVNGVDALVKAVDAAYKSVTSGKADPFYLRGLRAASSIFSVISALHNIILTNDDFIGNAVEASVTGDAPAGANWVVKSNGAVTHGWFTTIHQP